MTRTRAAVLLATVATALALTTACGQNDTHTNQPTSNNTATGATDTVRLVAATVGNLGKVVTDSNGYTLYLFEKDTINPPASNCNGACATNWPPVMAGSGDVGLQGIDRSLVGTVTRADGSKQVTLNGRPLYRYAKDAAPGDAKGQGAGGTWFAVTPEGKKAAETADSGYGY
jgi:predicted lipoprotein with Yx(FWY)xxD motif